MGINLEKAIKKSDKPIKLSQELWSKMEYTDILYIISKTFKEYREEHNISQKELSQMIGLSQPMLSKMESGEYNPSIKFLVKAWNILSTKEENFGAKLIGRIYEKVKNNYNYSANIKFRTEKNILEEIPLKSVIFKQEIKYDKSIKDSIMVINLKGVA